MDMTSFIIGYEAGKNSVVSAGVDPYYQQLAEALLMRHAEYVTGDEKTLVMKGFVATDGNTLGSVSSYSLAGFDNVEYMALSDTVIVMDNAFVGNSALKILDITASSVINTVGFYPNALTGCTALEAIVVRDGGIELATVNITNTGCGNDTFYVYVPSEYYDTIIANISSSGVPSSRYRKLEDYPAIDHYNEKFTVNFYDGDTLVDTKVVRYGETATTAYAKEGYNLKWEPSNTNITQNTDCYAQFTLDTSFATGSWATIANICESGEAANNFSLGDTRIITCNGNSYTVQIVGFNADTLTDGSGKAGISCLLTGVYGTTRAYNSTKVVTNWPGCTLRTYCNDTIYNGLEDGLKSIIKQVTKKSYSNAKSGAVTSNDYCWVPCTAEMGKAVWGGIASTYPAITSGVAARQLSKTYWCRDDEIIATGSTYRSYYIGTSNSGATGKRTISDQDNIRFGFCI